MKKDKKKIYSEYNKWMRKFILPSTLLVLLLVYLFSFVRPIQKTTPVPTTVPDPVIVAAGDIACGKEDEGEPCKQQETAALIKTLSPAGVLALGDLQYNEGQYQNFLNYYDPSWGQFKQITYPVPGNHDYGEEGAAGYFAYFGSRAGDKKKGYYSFDIGAWHLVALNSNCYAVGGCQKGSQQLAWLEQDLQQNTNKCTLAYWHHPRFSSGKEHGSDPHYANLWETLYAHGVDIVLNGHEHNYERFAPQDAKGNRDDVHGIREFIIGTGGRNLYGIERPIANSEIWDTQTYGVLTFTLRPTSYDWTFHPVAGSSFTDSGTASCH